MIVVELVVVGCGAVAVVVIGVGSVGCAVVSLLGIELSLLGAGGESWVASVVFLGCFCICSMSFCCECFKVCCWCTFSLETCVEVSGIGFGGDITCSTD